MKTTPVGGSLDDWRLIERLLPPGWEAQARALGALRRARGVADAGTLLRVLLVHLADGCSLAETVLRAARAGWCRISVVALIKRLRAAEHWLNWICQGLWQQRGRRAVELGRCVRVVDSTMVVEGGPTGSRWRIHYSLNLADLRCDFFELTDQSVGESLARFPVRRGDLLIGDRGLCRTRGIAQVLRRGGHVLGRVQPGNLPLFDGQGRPLRPLARVRRLAIGAPQEWPAWIQPEGQRPCAGRLIAIRRSKRAIELARRRARIKAREHERPVSAAALAAAAFVFLWTDLPPTQLSTTAALEWYRLRWQIELAFKRDKSLLGLGQLPKRNANSSRAWLHGKLLVALLVERLIAEADALSPWGYPLAPATQPLARNALDGS